MWNGLWWFGIAFLYFPLSQTRVRGEAAKAIFSKIDYIGGATSIGGLTLFLVALQAGGYSHPWTSAYVLATLIIGVLLIAAFVAWEWRYAKMPMVPREMFGKSDLLAFLWPRSRQQANCLQRVNASSEWLMALHL